MRPHFASFLISILAMSAAVSLDLPNLPQCAMNAFLSSVTSTGCGLTDTSCFCNNRQFIASMEAAVKAQCSGEDLRKAHSIFEQMCASKSVSPPPNTITTIPASYTPQLYTSTDYYPTITTTAQQSPLLTITTTTSGINNYNEGASNTFPVMTPPANTSSLSMTSSSSSMPKSTTSTQSSAESISLATRFSTVAIGIATMNVLLFFVL
ncbi:hypothetical protein EJ08DRAFT_700397 [Tothia fuscella]|uniref:CFEM domain-containing protein n=1 Tax=Tothia fuscella TaxID=1048955 RepID=A0A9P4NKR7_9PEZI|nr:hypothetical protein EJ08DRAFT_700397 [Tothia fuscella]